MSIAISALEEGEVDTAYMTKLAKLAIVEIISLKVLLLLGSYANTPKRLLYLIVMAYQECLHVCSGTTDKLEELTISECKSMVEIFESKEINKDGVDSTTNVDDGSDDTCTAITIPRSANMTLLELANLTILK
uniref:Uncharacterized protein n=1 Tax=Lactuca sativa TaxID=4236 RepID=A0A9R1XNP7_LACSA|nr:hypothetical protein LSAT_V11C200051560 [Lactuca sativa]